MAKQGLRESRGRYICFDQVSLLLSWGLSDDINTVEVAGWQSFTARNLASDRSISAGLA